MLREDRTEVLVVGAGPVGLLAALVLGEGGIEVKIIDQESRTATHSHACALHPRTLKLLARWGLAADALKLGRRIDTIAFYEGESRRAEIKLAELATDFPFTLVLPQNELEDLLEEKLRMNGRTQILWNHRLSELRAASDGVTATIDKLGQSAKGYVVPEWDWEVERTLRTRAAFVVGADGHNSHVRQCLDIESERLSGPELFAVFEFESADALANEARVVLDETTTSALWPLTDRRCRWSFQCVPTDAAADFPTKDRTTVLVQQPAVDVSTKQEVQYLLRERAPWFHESVGELQWSADVQFEHRLAKQFGRDRCWLAGDAAHQTGPVGMQSMNVGLFEAEELAAALEKILHENGSMALLETYGRNRREEWQRLLGTTGTLTARAGANLWARDRFERLLPCLPASGEDLASLMNQLGLEFC